MSRIVGTSSSAGERKRLLKEVASVFAHTNVAQPTPAEESDLVAYLALLLDRIAATVDRSAGAWEKRGYWLKADRLRQEWTWVGSALRTAEDTLRNGTSVREALAGFSELRAKTEAFAAPSRRRKTTPWAGAAEAWSQSRRAASF
ncbi:MAG: hypothetical protein WD906_03630 [Anaerolineales bacterium]